VDRFELYIADRRGFQFLVIFVSLEDEHVWLLSTDWLGIFVAENCALQFSVAVAPGHFAKSAAWTAILWAMTPSLTSFLFGNPMRTRTGRAFGPPFFPDNLFLFSAKCGVMIAGRT
jgi:hypothetical protein